MIQQEKRHEKSTTSCTMHAGGGNTQVKEARIILKGNAQFGSIKAAVAAVEREMEAAC